MDIDWSEAPEGATYYDTECDLFCNESGYWLLSGDWVPDNEQLEWGTIRYIQRPVQWNGEGLPPVGTVCEAWHMGSEQGVVEVRYSGECMVLWSVSRKHEQCSASENYTFKLLRTPEQIAAEERESEVSHIERCITNLKVEHQNNPRVIAEVLHNIGYRKQENNDAKA